MFINEDNEVKRRSEEKIESSDNEVYNEEIPMFRIHHIIFFGHTKGKPITKNYDRYHFLHAS